MLGCGCGWRFLYVYIWVWFESFLPWWDEWGVFRCVASVLFFKVCLKDVEDFVRFVNNLLGCSVSNGG